MRNRHGLPARIAPAVGSLFAIGVFGAGCGEMPESEPIIGGTGALAWCASDASSCELDSETTDGPSDWLVRCTSDDECAVGQCVCGLCSESCTGEEAGECSGVPAGAACFAGGTSARAALCHASTVAGICLVPCSPGDDCGEGYVCALGACLPEPPRR
jgi:hypothetical protein